LRESAKSVTGQSRVLVVDDDDTVREVLRRYLTRDGHEVIEAGDGITGLGLARSQHPDLVVLDLMLPGMDGLEVCRRLGADRPELVVVLLSADDDPLLRETARVAGAAGFVAKKDLRPSVLRALWERHGEPAAAITPPG
jgi:CheY-like chemotaxis protein